MATNRFPLRCPTCHQILDPATLCCAQNHCYEYQDGVLVLLTDEIAARLDHFAETVTQMRRAQRLPLLDPAIYETLPCSASLQDNPEWRWRCSELTVANTLINRHFENRRPLQILDVGAYNGWLSHQLARDGHAVTAIEYFRGAFDGLGAKKHYSSQWQAIQMDLVDLAPLGAHFDVVIMNHGLHFFPDPIAHAKQLMTKVTPDGLLLLLGLIFYRDPRRRRQQIRQADEDFRTRYNQPRLFRPAPGYLDFNDRNSLKTLGMALRPSKQFWLVNALSHLLPTLPWRGYGFKTGPDSG